MELLRSSPERVLQVSLEIRAETAWERIAEAAQKTGEFPPFLGGEDPRTVHRALHTRRAGAYREAAAISLEAEGLSPGEIAREIRRRLAVCCASAQNLINIHECEYLYHTDCHRTKGPRSP
jgi:shikimate kinase